MSSRRYPRAAGTSTEVDRETKARRWNRHEDGDEDNTIKLHDAAVETVTEGERKSSKDNKAQPETSSDDCS